MSKAPGLFAHLVPFRQSTETKFSACGRVTLQCAVVAAALSLGAASAAAQASFPNESLGAFSNPQAVPVTISTAGTVANIQVSTMGQAGLDFAQDTALTTCAGSVTTTCNVGVTFAPSAPGLRVGGVVLLDAGSHVLGTAYVYGTGVGPLGAFIPGYVIPYAGDGDYLGGIGDGNLATNAELYLPAGIAFDGAANLYIADTAHNRVRMVCAGVSSGIINGTQAGCTAAGIIITVAGEGGGCAGQTDSVGDGCPAGKSTVSGPGGVTVDGAGNLYIADTGNNEIRVVNSATGIITVFAGDESGLCAGKTDSLGDGCPATSATLNEPQGMTLDVFGNLYIADTANDLIRMVAPSGVITTFAGGGTGCGAQTDSFGNGCTAGQAILKNPYPVAFDASGNMYIPDSSNNEVREVAATGGVVSSTSTISKFAGTGAEGYTGNGGPASNAALFAPSGVAIDPAQNVYIADTQNNVIRMVSANSSDIETIVSSSISQTYNATPNYFGPLRFYGPIGLAFDSNGDLYIGDSLEMLVQEMQSNLVLVDQLPPPTTNVTLVGATSAQQNITVANIGNAPLDLSAITPQTNLEVSTAQPAPPAPALCATGTPNLAVGDDCTVGVIFAPTVSGDPLIDDIDVTGQTANSPLVIEVVGDAAPQNTTITTITSNPNPSNFGQGVTFTVTVTTGANTGALTGTVTVTDTFNSATTTLASNVALGPSGTATIPPISTLPVGIHSIVAAYSGDSAHTKSTSTDNGAPPLLQTVNEQTTTTLVSSGSPSTLGQNVMFTATVAIVGSAGVTPQGTVTFMNGTTVLGTPQTLGAGLTATYSTTALPLGSNPITAVYSGDATIEVLGSTSAVLKQDVQTASTAAVTSAPNPSNYGTQVTFTATISSATTISVGATGTVTFLDNGTSIGTGTLSGDPATAQFQTSSLAVGTHPITVSYPGDANFAGATSSPAYSQTVNPVPTSVAVSSTPATGVAGVPVAITATISSSANSSLLTGTVTFTIGTQSVGPVTVTGGVATTNQTLPAGTYQVVATYSGTSNLGGSTSNPYTLTIASATTTATLSITPNPAVADSTITFSAAVTSNGVAPTGSVSFMSGGTTLGTATLTKGVALYNTNGLAVGSYSVTAVYAGDANNGTTTSPAVNLTVGLIPTTTDLVAASTSGTPPQVLLVGVVTGTAGPTPTGTLTFSTNGQTIGSATLDSSGVGSFTPNLPNGTYQVVASYGGDSIHSPSKSTAVSVSGAPAGFSMTVTPNNLSMNVSQNATVTVNVASVGGFTDTVALGCASLPVGVTCTFVNPSVTLGANASATSQLTIDTNSPLSGGSSAMNAGKGKGLSLAGLFLPFSVFFGFAFWRLRRRSASLLTIVLVAALSLGALVATGCSGFGGSTVKPGTYSVVITGIGTQSNTIHYTTLTLTITK
jgi:sugar lactone lactonase YvrE